MLTNWAIKQYPLFKIKGWQIQPVATAGHTWPPLLVRMCSGCSLHYTMADRPYGPQNGKYSLSGLCPSSSSISTLPHMDAWLNFYFLFGNNFKRTGKKTHAQYWQLIYSSHKNPFWVSPITPVMSFIAKGSSLGSWVAPRCHVLLTSFQLEELLSLSFTFV